MEIIVKGKTVEEALANAAKQLGKSESELEYIVVEEAKKGFLGMFSQEAEIKVSVDDGDDDIIKSADLKFLSDEAEETECEAVENAQDLPDVDVKIVEFLNTIIADMGVDAKANVSRVDERIGDADKKIEKDIHVEIVGKGLGMLIGRHGDVLDSLQYLCNILVGRYPKKSDKHEYVRIILDIENYREKRTDTLKSVARRTAQKVLASGRNFTLEPMSSYERRIIHSEIQQISGVHTYSIGADSSRRVVVAYGDDVSAQDEE